MQHNSFNTDTSVEGIFDGQSMVGTDGKLYPILPNYASKSKLVTGDHMKLYILEDGAFIYKQTMPMARKRLVGVVTEEMSVLVDNKLYSILGASMSYFKARAGDEAVVLVPATGESEWAALENIIKERDDIELNQP